jgi:hypothetical protein
MDIIVPELPLQIQLHKIIINNVKIELISSLCTPNLLLLCHFGRYNI